MFLSIIVPVYNIKEYLEECIESLLAQNFSDYEIILVDDGSFDGSSEMCDFFSGKEEKIQVIHKQNGGLSDARNYGIRAAKGRYILFVDGDDYIESNSLLNICTTCREQRYPDVLFLNMNKVFPDGKIVLLDEKMCKNKIYEQESINVLDYICSLKKYPASAGSKMVLKDMIYQNNLFFEFGVKSEDIDWTKRVLFSAKTFGYYEGKYYYYRQNREGSISNSLSFQNFSDICKVIDRWVDEAKISSQEKRKILYSFSCYEYKILFVVYQKIEKCYRKEAVKWMKNNKWLLKFRNDKQVKIIRMSYRILGINLTSKLIYAYIRNRKS